MTELTEYEKGLIDGWMEGAESVSEAIVHLSMGLHEAILKSTSKLIAAEEEIVNTEHAMRWQ